MMRNRLWCLLVLALVLVFPGLARADDILAALNGGWNVVVFAEKGKCDGSYRFPVQIKDGIVVYNDEEGTGVVDITGKVETGGRINVTVQRGAQKAVAAGQLTPGGGRGTWTEKGPDSCSGRWEARRD